MSKKQIVTLALDTSNTNTGYSVWINGEYNCCGNAVTDEDLELWQKTDVMIANICYMFKIHPDIVVCEQLDCDNNHKVNSAHSEVIGSVKTLSLQNGSTYYDYRPTDWRKLVDDGIEKIPRKRKELKIWDLRRAHRYLQKINKDEDIDDNAADAILIGLAYMNQFLEG